MNCFIKCICWAQLRPRCIGAARPRTPLQINQVRLLVDVLIVRMNVHGTNNIKFANV
jgi:hypothetical protein